MNEFLKPWLILGLLLGTAVYAIAEDITLTTYYPSPRGVYQELRASQAMAIGTTDALPANTLMLIHGQGTTSATTALRIENRAGNPLFVVTDGGDISTSSSTTPFIIDSAGNVGIGTSVPTNPAPNGQPGNLDANDVFLRSIGTWASQTAGGTIPVFSCPTFVCPFCNGDCNGQLTLNPTCTMCVNGDRGSCNGPTACSPIGHLSP